MGGIMLNELSRIIGQNIPFMNLSLYSWEIAIISPGPVNNSW